MSRHVIVWDLETVPDIAGYAAANGLTGKSTKKSERHLATSFQSTSTTRLFVSARSSLIGSLTIGQ
jgi:hypothetical protein